MGQSGLGAHPGHASSRALRAALDRRQPQGAEHRRRRARRRSRRDVARPSRSYVEIQQTVGRATRVSAGKREGFVLLPVYSSADGSEDAAGDEGAAGEEGAAPEGAGADAGAALAGGFETAINVIRAMLEADEALQQRPSAALVEVGRTSRSLDALAVLGPRVEAVGVPLTLVKEQLGTVLLRLGDPWDRWYGRLAAYAAEHGNCLVPRGYKTADGSALGTWVNTQRQAYKGANGGLSAPRASRLEALGMVWNVR